MNFFELIISFLGTYNVVLASVVLFSIVIFLSGISIYIFYTCKKYKKKFRNLSASAAHYQTLVEHTPDTIYLIFSKTTLRFEYISPSITLMTGFLPEKFYDEPEFFKSLIHSDDLPEFEASLKAISLKTPCQLISLRLLNSEKSFVDFELNLVPIFDQTQCCAQFCVIGRKAVPIQGPLYDMSYLERLTTIGQMASSVAHEIRNPLTTVRGYLQFFSLKPEFNNYREHFELLINELDRTSLIIKEYLALNQSKTFAPKSCQLNNIIRSLYPLLKADANNINKDIQIKLGDIPELYLAENEIRQLILNMVKNGLEAMSEMKDRTIITISTYKQDDKIVMSIKDQGPGIAPHILENIGKPFLTTKKTGTGLGLTICYQIVNEHKAQIEVNSKHNGTEFFVKFSPKVQHKKSIKKAM